MELVDCSGMLPELKRRPGYKSWKVRARQTVLFQVSVLKCHCLELVDCGGMLPELKRRSGYKSWKVRGMSTVQLSLFMCHCLRLHYSNLVAVPPTHPPPNEPTVLFTLSQ